MNSKNFEISLISGKEYLTTYEWYLIPNVGDVLNITEQKVVVVRERLLPCTDSNRVVLFVDYINIADYKKYY